MIFRREVAVRDGGRHLRDVPHLRGEVAREGVHVLGQVQPDARHAAHVRLAAELALGADLARDARDLVGEGGELVDHRVDRVLQLGDLARGDHGDLAAQVAVRDGGRHVCDVPDLGGEVAGERVHVLGQVAPDAADAFHLRLPAELTVGADLARDARHLRRERAELVDHRVDGLLELEHLALDVDGDLPREVAVRDGRRDVRDVADLGGEVAGERVHVLGQVAPDAAHALHLCLAAEDALVADLARDARHLAREDRELVDHRVHGVLELEHLALDVDGHLLAQVAVGDRGRHVGDVPHLRGEVRGHLVDRVREVLPDARDAPHLRLAAELAVGADLARDARHLGRERGELVDHRVHRRADPRELALHRLPVDLELHLP